MPRPKKKKEPEQFSQYMVDFEFYFITSFSKQKSVIKMQLYCQEASPDESIAYTYKLLTNSFTKAFNKTSFNKNVVRFRKIQYCNVKPDDYDLNNLGASDAEKIESISSILKKHMLV